MNFESLRVSITSLQNASVALEEEKADVQKHLRKLLKKWKKKHSKLQRLKKKARKALCRIKKAFGKKCTHRHECSSSPEASSTSTDWDVNSKWGVSTDIEVGMLLHEDPDGDLKLAKLEPFELSHHYRHKFPIAKLRKVVKRIREANKKSTAIEKGFISEDGIKDREWYKHLAVAPGKWLGISKSKSVEINDTNCQFNHRLRCHYLPSSQRSDTIRTECNFGSA